MEDKAHQKMVKRAYELKHAWLFCYAWVGLRDEMDGAAFERERYEIFPKQRLKSFLRDLEHDYFEVVKYVLERPSKARAQKAIPWFASKYREWHEANQPIYCIGNFQQVDASIGPLAFARKIETPVYAEVILQGYLGCCCRHPEYMLARDLSLAHNLFLDAEEIIHKALSKKEPCPGHLGENALALGRLACVAAYNLMEGFLSGLILEAQMRGDTDSETIGKLNKMQMAPLKKRFFEIPLMLKGTPVSEVIPMAEITEYFDELKRRRDAFVHCVPGVEPAKQGYVRQEYFNDVHKELVERVIFLTVKFIREIWNLLNGRNGPRWLKEQDESGRFMQDNLSFVEDSIAGVLLTGNN